MARRAATRRRLAAAASASLPSSPAALLNLLDDEVLMHLLQQQLPAIDLARACCCCARLRAVASGAAALLLRRRKPSPLPPPGTPYNSLRALGTAEALERQLGCPRSSVRAEWRDEYVALQTEDFRLYQLLTGEAWGSEHLDFCAEFFGAGGERSVDACLSANAGDIEWRVGVAGWSRQHAEVVTLLMTSGAAMSRSLSRIKTFAGRPRNRLPVSLGRPVPFPASVWAVCDALAAAALRQSGPAPPHLYSPLSLPPEAWGTGPGCLLEEDAAWGALLRRKAKAGLTLRTRSFVNAEEASRYALGSGEGFLIHNDESETPVHASEVVRFINRRADALGFHSLIQDAPGEGLRSRSGPGYTLPPFATVVLERVDAPGEWRLYGKEMRCRLFTCSVTYSL